MRSATRQKIGKDRDYLAFIVSLPCFLCERMGLAQTSRTEAAHVGKRGLSQKCSDRETAPLCGEHHRTGPVAHHQLGRNFWELHGINRSELLKELQRRFEEWCCIGPAV